MLPRTYLIVVTAVLLAAPCYAAKSIGRDGSTMEKAILLKQRGAKAVEEEMTWMMKLCNYTPVLATRDEIVKLAADAIRRAKSGQKQPSGHPPAPWGHATRDRNGRLISYWWFQTPHGRKEIYFDTGTSLDTPGEVARQESSRAEYMVKMMQHLKL
jgi:hypothetical protein